MASPAPAAFRIDLAVNDLLLHSHAHPPAPPEPKGGTLPEPVFPQRPELLNDHGLGIPPAKREWHGEEIMRKVRGWLVPYMRSRVMPGTFTRLLHTSLSGISAT
jgi:hypothetical protein